MRFITIPALFTFVISLSAQVNFTTTNLPIITIQTNGSQIQDEPKIKADMSIIYNGPGMLNKISDIPNEYNGKIGIELRGSSSQWFPKKPYGFETWDEFSEDNNVKLLGMPKESDWTLNAAYNDKTLMRDGLSYILAGAVMDYAPRVRYNELLINGQYQGIYLLVEKIKRDKIRVDIAKIESTDIQGDALTGGYIIKIDKETGSNSSAGWNSLYAPYSGALQKTYFQFEYPKADEISYEQKNYIRNHMNIVENSIAGQDFKDPVKGYRKYIDTESLMDYIIINELAKNPDAYRLSTFFYKERDSDGGKIKFGPVWDFNLGFGNVDYCTQGNPEGLVILNFNEVCPGDGWLIHFWWKKFLQDENFYSDLKYRWKNLRDNQLSNDRINFVMDSLSNMLGQAQVRNFQQWTVLGQYVWPNYYIGNTYGEEVSHLKNWIKNRLIYLDKVWEIKDSNVIETENIPVVLVPNPANDAFSLQFLKSVPKDLKFRVISSSGQILHLPYYQLNEYSLQFNINHLAKGMYFIQLTDNEKKHNIKFVKQ